MKYIMIVVLSFILPVTLFAQNSVQLNVKDAETKQPLANATLHIQKSQKTILTDSMGIATLQYLPAGKYTLLVSYAGYQEGKYLLNLLEDNNKTIEILLEAEGEMDEVIISSTRTSRNIKNVATRIETIDEEEIDEKVNMRAANVSMVLHESTGIQVQQTSATSGNASIRLQGLDGRYTQILKDGYPNFGNFASGLSILEIPPLDLKQVEIIKGPASTLYGAGAIAGVINFISKTPGTKPAYNFIFNQSNLGGTDIATFLSARKNKVGYTLLASANFQKPYDVDDDDFTELPKSSYYTITPKLFLYLNDKTTLTISNSFSTQERLGGDIKVIKGKADNLHQYFEKNNSVRNISTVELDFTLKNNAKLTAKQSFSIFNRKIEIPGYAFKGKQHTAFTDISYLKKIKKHTLIGGLNYLYDNFTEDTSYSVTSRNSNTNTGSIFIQDTWDINNKLSFENGVRADFVKHYGAYILPRISALYKFTNAIAGRITAGLGYKLPTLFTEQTETIQYRNVLAINNDLNPEKSYGGTADINIKKKLGSSLNLSVNQMFFLTSIENSLLLNSNANNEYYFSNAKANVISKGFETNIKFIYKNDYKLFIGYTFTDAKAKYLTGNQYLPLLPKNKLNLALIYETENNIKAGFEAYYTDRQFLSNNAKTSPFWELGFMIEKTFHKIAVFINAENFTDVRQSRYKTVSNLPHNNPTFDEIWTHTEGRSFNAGIKVKL